MDVRTGDLGRLGTVAGSPDDAPPLPRAQGRWTRLARRLLALAAPDPTRPGDVTQARRGTLYGYTAASIVTGLVLLVVSTLVYPVRSGIDPDLPGTAVAGPTGGLLLWVLFGFLGSLRVLRTPGGAGFLTFHLPFIGAAMVLGGPTAGAWVAFLSTIERRELEQQPWYGILANHAVIVIGAVVGGLVTQLVSAALAEPAHPGAASFVATVTGTFVLAGITTTMSAITVMLRDELTPKALLDVLLGRFGRVSALEIALAWVLVLAYTETGWWTPMVIGGFVLFIWDNHPMPAPDALTGLASAEGFVRRLEAGLGRLRRGMTPGATLYGIDLDYFKRVNDRYGHAVGDEVLGQVGARLRAQARRPSDLAGRRGGDEFALFLPGLCDVDVAMRRADEVCAAIAGPIATSIGPVTIGASIGVVMLQAWGGLPSTGTILKHADQAMYLAKRGGGGPHLYDPREPAPFDDGWIEDRR